MGNEALNGLFFFFFLSRSYDVYVLCRAGQDRAR